MNMRRKKVIKPGDKVCCLLDLVNGMAVMLESMTVVAVAEEVTLKDVEGEVIRVPRARVWATMKEAETELGFGPRIYNREGPVSDGWHKGV
jgi:hypothetical protein